MLVCRVAFKKLGKRYYFNPNGINLKNGDKVIVETIRGIELGEVIGDLIAINEDELEIKPILRLAKDSDLADYNKNKEEAKSVIDVTKEEVKKLNLL